MLISLSLDLEDGNTAWSFQADERLTSAASYAEGRIFQPADGGRLYVLSSDDGKLLYEVELKGPIVSLVAAAERAYVNDVLGNVYGLEPKDGSILWTTALDDPLWGAPTVADGLVFVATSAGDLVALDQSDGSQVWKYEVEEVLKASPLAVGSYLVAGTLRGQVISLDARTGKVVDTARVKGAIEFAPVTDGENVIVVSQAGKIVCFGENNEPHNRADNGGQSQR